MPAHEMPSAAEVGEVVLRHGLLDVPFMSEDLLAIPALARLHPGAVAQLGVLDQVREPEQASGKPAGRVDPGGQITQPGFEISLPENPAGSVEGAGIAPDGTVSAD